MKFYNHIGIIRKLPARWVPKTFHVNGLMFRINLVDNIYDTFV